MQTIAKPAIIVGNNDPTNSILKSQDYYFGLDFKTAENELGKVKDYLRIIRDALKVVHRMQCC